MPFSMLPGVLLASGNGTLQRILTDVVWIYIVVLVARALLSWFPSEPGTALYSAVRVLDRFTEPVLRPVRRLMPPLRAGGMAVDLSIIVTILVLEIVVVQIIIPAL